MSQKSTKSLIVATGLALAGLNIVIVAFYALWAIADSTSINAMESATSVNPARMLPNSNLMWLAANGSLALMVVVDVLTVIGARQMGKSPSAVPTPAGAPARELLSR